MRSIWRYAEGEEVFITYGHETSAELLASYGFFPAPNAGDFVRLYADMQDILDDDRYLSRDANRDAALAMEREAVMWSALAVDAPLAVRRAASPPPRTCSGACGSCTRTARRSARCATKTSRT